MAAVMGRCYTAATRSIVATSVVNLHGDHLGVKVLPARTWLCCTSPPGVYVRLGGLVLAVGGGHVASMFLL